MTIQPLMTRTRRHAVSIWLAGGAALCLMLSGCSSHVGPPTPVPVPGPSSPPVPQTAGANMGARIVAYKIASAGDKSNDNDNNLVPVTVDIRSGAKDTARSALDALTTGSDSPLPPGTKVLSVNISPDSKLAIVDFSKQFRSNFQGGDTHEAQAVESVLLTLGQFPTVSHVQFLVNGHKIQSLGGTVDLDAPLPTPQNSLKFAAS